MLGNGDVIQLQSGTVFMDILPHSFEIGSFFHD